MTQLSSDNQVTDSHPKNANNGNVFLGIPSKSFYGNSSGNSKPRTHPYNPPWSRVSESENQNWGLKRYRTSPLSGHLKRPDIRYHASLKSMSVPPQDIQREPLRTSLSSPPRKQRRTSSPRCIQLTESRVKRTLSYPQSETENSSEEFSTEDESNKENWNHNTNVDINSILETLDRDEVQDSSKSKEDPLAEKTENLTPPKKIILPQDIGFPNPPGSNRCWMNATLQALLGMEVFIEQLEQTFWSEERTNQTTLLHTFFEVIRLRRHGKPNSLNLALRKFSSSLGTLDAMFSTDRQQDATEFLVRLLDLFREQYTSSERSTLRELHLDNLPAAQRGGGDDPVSENVEFTLKETYCCDSCCETSSKSQNHLALYLDVPPTSPLRPSLQEALSRYMEPDVRELKCTHCSGQRTRVSTSFTKLPRFLLVQVKRYAVQTAIAEKLTSLLRIPISLSAKNFVSSDVMLPAPWSPKSKQDEDLSHLSMEDDEERDLQEALKQSLQDEDLEAIELEKAIQLSLQEQRMTNAMQDADLSLGEDVPFEGEDDGPPDYSYRLVCLIMHQGLSPNCGHYVADVYNIEQQQWYHYDDETVSHPTEEEVLGKSRQRNGYVFCYMHKPLFDELAQRQVEGHVSR